MLLTVRDYHCAAARAWVLWVKSRALMGLRPLRTLDLNVLGEGFF